GVAIIVAMDPIALRHSSLVMTETLAIFFATIGLWLLSCGTNGRRLPFLLGGVVFGLFGLCRPTFLIWAGLIGLAVMLGLLSRPRESKRKNLLNSVLFFSGILCILAPWIARNHQLYGRLILATTHGGYTLFLGNNDSFYDYLRSGKRSPWNGENELQETVKKIRKDCQFFSEEWQGVIVDEVKKDRLYYDKAIEVIRRRPLDFCYACLIRAVRFWCIIPNSSDLESPGQTVIRLGAGIWYGILFAFVWVGAFQWIQCFVRNPVNRWFLFQKSLPAILLIIAFQGLHLVYWSNMRMRAPLVVVLALLAVLGTVKGVAVCQTPGALGENENKPRK
ncbi:MAG: hypothetical protein VX438_08560, partial [Planctomycetota bacterium]|nr:hypothetical protein [Planctomycetota bacterium]